MNATETAERLAHLSEGLLFISESEYPLEQFLWQAADLTTETILTRAGKPVDTSIEEITLDDFFAPVATEEDWHDDEDRKNVQRFQELVKALSALENIQVFKLGKVEIDVYIVGAIGKDLVGLKTTVIET